MATDWLTWQQQNCFTVCQIIRVFLYRHFYCQTTQMPDASPRHDFIAMDLIIRREALFGYCNALR